MEHFDSASSAALLASLLLLLSMLWMRRRQHQALRSRSSDALDTIQAWPPQAVRVMTQAERQAYELLRRAVPNHLVLAQVPLSRFISVPTRQSYGEWLNRAGRLSADLLICDEHARVIAAIDVRSPEESSRSRERHERLTRVLEAARIPVQVWNASSLPSVSHVRMMFAPLIGELKPVQEVVAPPPRIDAPSGLQELLEVGDATDYGLDPVASGFFEDLEVAPAPRQ